MRVLLKDDGQHVVTVPLSRVPEFVSERLLAAGRRVSRSRARSSALWTTRLRAPATGAALLPVPPLEKESMCAGRRCRANSIQGGGRRSRTVTSSSSSPFRRVARSPSKQRAVAAVRTRHRSPSDRGLERTNERTNDARLALRRKMRKYRRHRSNTHFAGIRRPPPPPHREEVSGFGLRMKEKPNNTLPAHRSRRGREDDEEECVADFFAVPDWRESVRRRR